MSPGRNDWPGGTVPFGFSFAIADLAILMSPERSAHPGVAQLMFRTLSQKGINIQVISTSEIKVSVLIAEEYVELAVRALHSAYELDAA